MSSNQSEANVADTQASPPELWHTAAQAFQDGIIGSRLPAWMRRVPVGQMAQLSKTLAESLAYRQQVDAALAKIEAIDGFVASALNEALGERYGATYNVRWVNFLEGHREPVINAQPVGSHLTKVVYQETPLLEVAMRNFTAEQAESGGQPRGNRLLIERHAQVPLPTAIEFAALCRELDLGERYQRHLDGILSPSGRGPGVEPLLVGAYRHAMLVDAVRARHTDVLDDSELQLVMRMCLEGKLSRLAGDLVVARQLKLFGCWIEQIVVLEVVDQGPLFDTARQLLMYIPGDPQGAWSKFPDLRRLANEIGRRLRVESYQRFFSRFVRRRDCHALFSNISPDFENLPIWANGDLDERLRNYPEPLFNTLASARVRQIKDDAAMILVPVREIDRQVQRAHDEYLVSLGWNLLAVAGLFVPAIGAAVLAVTAYELLGEVYHGIEAWSDGDRREALGHLTNVATDLALIAATAAGIAVARRAWQRSVVVDGLMPARLEDGTTKLWQPELTPYRGEPPAAATLDAEGVRRLEGEAWVEMDGHHYPVVRSALDGHWQLRPRAGHGPQLRGNGAGAWRLWSEQPAEWSEKHRLFRRLGEGLRELDDEQIDQVLTFHGLGADELRGLHVYGRAAPAGLYDSVQRCALDGRIRDLVRRLRSGMAVDDIAVLQGARGLPGAAELADQALAELAWAQRRRLLQVLYEGSQQDSVSSAALRRVFPSLHRRAADELLRAASALDRQRLLESGRIPLRLAEAARESSVAIRMARVYEGLYLDTPQNADLAKVVLGMLRYLPGASNGVRWRLFEGYMNGPLLLSTEAADEAFDLVHVSGQFQRLDAQGLVQGEPGELFEVVGAAYTAAQREAMGINEPFSHNLRVLLTRQAVQRREEVKLLLSRAQRNGAFRLPLRLADGRIGYPLGGGGVGGFSRRNNALSAMLRELFPTLTDQQITSWIASVRQSGQRVEVVLAQLRQEFDQLSASLGDWVRQGSNDNRADREFVQRALLNGWQRRGASPYETNPPETDSYLMLYGAMSGGLPELPARVRFDHVTHLALLRMELREIPVSFLLPFRRLRVLDLGDNRLTRLPDPLLQMQHLHTLILTSNQIVLDSTQAASLASCEGLEYIDLSHNPLGRAFSLNGLNHLRWLNLHDTRIDQLPSGLLDRPVLYYADMRDNRITQLPDAYYQAPLGVRRRMRLTGNPFPSAEMTRVQQALRGPDVPLDEAVVGEYARNVREIWGDAVGPEHRAALVARWDTLEQTQHTSRFFRVLRQLLGSADFQRQPRPLALRVLALLKAMSEDRALCEELLNVSNDEWGCQDGATWCLSNLELKVLVWQARAQAQGNTEQALLTLGRRLWRLDEVDRLTVQDIIDRGGDPDESEVGLAYRLGLRDRLGLPIEVGDMSFRPVAGVDQGRIERALARVREAETQERVARSLVERDFWQIHLERAHADEFSRVDARFHERLEAVLDDQSLAEPDRSRQVEAIREEQLAARRGLMLEMTIRSLETGSENVSIDV